MRTFFAFVVLMLGLSVGAYALDLDGARRQGLVGERADGLVGAVTNAADAEALVKAVNAERMRGYQEIAAKQGTKIDAVQAIAGGMQIEKARQNGWYYMDASGSWKKN